MPVVVLSTQARRIEAHRKSIELELLQEIENGRAPELAATDESATTPAPNASGPSTDPDSVERLSPEGKNTGNDGTSADNVESGNKERDGNKERETDNDAGSEADGGGEDPDGLAALAEELRRLEEQDRLEHEAEMARLKK